MPDLLGYTTVSPSNFIDQVEERSSLLIQQGLEKNERGKLVPSYEFSHLSFQEYLTAKAVVEGWTPEDMDHAVSHLKAHLDETQWLEVVPWPSGKASGRVSAEREPPRLPEPAETGLTGPGASQYRFPASGQLYRQ